MKSDYLVCQGTEVSDHIHASKPLIIVLKEVLAVAGKVPVVASGGIRTGHDIRKYIAVGAEAGVLSSRFFCDKRKLCTSRIQRYLIKILGQRYRVYRLFK
ncbi:MAG: nitronate monooxygenase [Flavobacteriaceae bacterium]